MAPRSRPRTWGRLAVRLPRAVAHARERARSGVRGLVRWLVIEQNFLRSKLGAVLALRINALRRVDHRVVLS